jgi:NhaP-type Na+/H+ or K+/H+ antiporter
VGALTASVVVISGGKGLIDETWRRIIPVAGAVAAYGMATALGGSGFIAFIAGGLFGLLAREEATPAMGFTEEAGALLASVTFLVFGAVLLGPALQHVTWQDVVYAALSLTVIRMLPVALSLWGTHARAPTVSFVAWFGPRGLASSLRCHGGGCAHSSRRDGRHRNLSNRRPVGPGAWPLGSSSGSLRQLVPIRFEGAPPRYGKCTCA